ncbi:MAG TPA: OmpA family protein [Terriglobia bacterium]|nr:OmpA family protein [Terriglobia bacterium]
MNRFCAQCGAPISEGSAFCGKCGSPLEAPAAQSVAPPLPPQAATPSPVAASIPAPRPAPPVSGAPVVTQPKKSGNLFLKVVIVIFAFIALVSVLVIGSCFYIGYRVKKRVDQVQQAYQHNDVGGIVAAVTGKGGNEAPQKLPEWKPAPADLASSPAAKVPLLVGLQLVNAGNERLRGDFESILAIDSVTAQKVHIKGSEEFPNAPSLSLPFGGAKKSMPLAKKINCGRTLLRQDLENSAEASGVCWNGEEDTYPGTTAIGFSKATYMELKTTGEARFTDHEDPMKELFSSFKRLASGSGDSSQFLTQLMSMAPGSAHPATPPIHCTLHRVGTADVAFPVMINDKETVLPAMHINWKRSDTDQEDAYILDDPDNPMALAYQSESEGIGQVIRIYLPVKPSSQAGGGGGGGGGAAGAGGGGGSGAGGGGGGGSGQAAAAGARQIEQELEKNGRVKIYDIYFDFASATLRPESKKVMDEISIVMHDHPDWKLRIEGHTDNIGGDAYNLDLSRRRAAAVKQALVTLYRIDAVRFSTAGFGASRPVATNETLEGRALNRRVELVRQ